MWDSETAEDADLICDGVHVTRAVVCYHSRGGRRSTVLAARAAGWAVWDGATIGGGWLSSHLCPLCAKRPKAPGPYAILAGQLEAVLPEGGDD